MWHPLWYGYFFDVYRLTNCLTGVCGNYYESALASLVFSRNIAVALLLLLATYLMYDYRCWLGVQPAGLFVLGSRTH